MRITTASHRNPPLPATQTHLETHPNPNKNPWVTAWWERFAKPGDTAPHPARESEIGTRGVLRCEIDAGVGGVGVLFEISAGGCCSRSVLGAAMRDWRGGGMVLCEREKEKERERESRKGEWEAATFWKMVYEQSSFNLFKLNEMYRIITHKSYFCV